MCVSQKLELCVYGHDGIDCHNIFLVAGERIWSGRDSL